MTTTTDLKNIVRQPLPLEWLLAANQEVTEEKLQAAQKAQRYSYRERIPESLLRYTDLYHELTQQEPTKQTLSDWIATAEQWKAEQFDDECIRKAFERAMANDGFPVGRMGSLTVTARGIWTRLRLLEAHKRTIEFIERSQDDISMDEMQQMMEETKQRVKDAMERLEQKRKEKQEKGLL